MQDIITGLVWEVKTPETDVDGIHNRGNTYRWGGITAIGLGHPDAGTYYDDWDELVNGSKPREIYAPHYYDRVVHHILVPKLEKIIVHKYIHDSTANQKNKGTHFAVARL